MTPPHPGHYPALLAQLKSELGQSWSQLADTLTQVVDPSRPPYSRTYLIRLAQGKDRITPEIARALDTLAAMTDGQSELQARSRPAQVLATYDLLPTDVVLEPPRACALPGCQVRFVSGHPRRRYCSRECRAEAARRRR